MSPREDGTMPEGWLEVYVPCVGQVRMVSFLAYKLWRKSYAFDSRRDRYCPTIGGQRKRGPKRREVR